MHALRRGTVVLLAVSILLAAFASTIAVSAKTSSKIDGSKALASDCSSIRQKEKSTIPKITIAVGTDAQLNPFDYVNPTNPNQIIGLEPSLMSIVASCLDFHYTYVNAGFASVIESVETGVTPLAIEGIYLTAAREKQIDYVQYVRSYEEAIVRPSLVSTIHNVMDLCGLTGGVTTGSVEFAYLTTLSAQCTTAGKKAITINAYPTGGGELALFVSSGRIDFSIGGASLVAPELKEYPGTVKSSIVIPALSFNQGIGVSKKDASFGRAVADAVEAIQAKHLEVPLLEKWGQIASDQVPAKFVR